MERQSFDPVKLCLFGGSDGSFFANVVNDSVRLLAPHVVIAGVVASRNAEKAKTQGKGLGIEYVFESIDDFLAHAKQLGISGVLIETPNAGHHPIARKCADYDDDGHRLAICSDKPTAHCWAHALEMAAMQKSRPTLVLNSYEGNRPWRMARAIIRSGVLGTLRRVKGTYDQHWLDEYREGDPTTGGHQQATGRLDPEIVGPFCSGLDLGIHLARSVHSITGKRIAAVHHFDHHIHLAEEGRKMDDHSLLTGRLEDGTPVSLEPCQVSWHRNGCNDHEVIFDCEKGSIRVSQMEVNTFWATAKGHHGDAEFCRGEDYSGHPVFGSVFQEAGFWMDGYPSRHPFGLNNAIADLIGAWAEDVRTWAKDGSIATGTWYPNLRDGALDWAPYEAARLAHEEGKLLPMATPTVPE